MTSQIATKEVKISSVIRSAAFVRGFKETQRKIPMDYDAYSRDIETHERWCYERGRQFGFIYSGQIKTGAKVNHSAIFGYAEAYRKNLLR